MGLDAKQIGLHMSKGIAFFVKTWYRSVFYHPFIWGLLVFFVLLYRFVPTLFFYLVSSSPVIACTAVLLGILLSFGHPHIPEVEEVEKEEKITHEISSLKVGVVHDDLIAEKDEGFGVGGERREIAETRIEDPGIEGGKFGDGGEIRVSKSEKGVDFLPTHNESDEIEIDGDVESRGNAGLLGTAYLTREFHPDQELLIEKKEFLDQKLVEKSSSKASESIEEGKSVHFGFEERVEGQKTESEIKIKDLDKPEGESLGSCLEKPSDSHVVDSPWKQFDNQDDGTCNSDSDHSESSSSDASMTDILPMLDELHPLLDSDLPQAALIPLDETDGVSEGSSESHESEGSSESHESEEEDSGKSDDERDIQEANKDQRDKTEIVVTWTEDDEKILMELGSSELERDQRLENLIAKRQAWKNQSLNIDKSEDEDEIQEDPNEDQEDETEVAGVIWTEDDEKNLLDLGTSELERNQRLESLIAKRQARKHHKADNEKNLIDLHADESSHTQIPPVSPITRNPFDLPYDSDETVVGLSDLGSQEIPAIMLPKRNPFDLPCNPIDARVNDEGQSSTSSSNHQEFLTIQQNDMYLQKHESSMLGQPFLGEIKQDKNDMHVASFYEAETKNPVADCPNFLHQVSLGKTGFTEIQRQSCSNKEKLAEIQNERNDSKLDSVHETLFVSSDIVLEDERGAPEQEFCEGDVLISSVNQGTESVERDVLLQERRSQSSEEAGLMEIEEEHSDIEVHDVHEIDSVSSDDTEDTHPESYNFQQVEEEISHSIGSRSQLSEIPCEEAAAERFVRSEMIEEKFEGTISSSSSSEGDENFFEENTDKVSDSIEKTWGDFSNRSGDSGQVEEPVYDSSPSALEKTHSDMARIAEAQLFVESELFSSGVSVASDAQTEISEAQQFPAAPHGDSQELVSSQRSSAEEIDNGGYSTDAHHGESQELVSLQRSTAEEIDNDDYSTELVHELEDDHPLNTPAVTSVLENKSADLVGSPLKAEEIQIAQNELNDAKKAHECKISSGFEDDHSLNNPALISVLENKSEDLIESPPKDEDQIMQRGGFQVILNDEANKCNIAEEESGKIKFSATEVSGEIRENTKLSHNLNLQQNQVEPSLLVHELHHDLVVTGGEEGEEDLKEINEELLSELDVVGDFSVNDTMLNPKWSEKQFELHLDSDEKISQDVEMNSVEEIDSDLKLPHGGESQNLGVLQSNELKQVESEAGSSGFILEERNLEQIESTSELQVLEARSLEDIDMGLKKFIEHDYEKESMLQFSDDQQKTLKSEVCSIDFDLSGRNPKMMESNLDVDVLEAQSPEDIDKPEGDPMKHIELHISKEDETELLESEVGFVNFDFSDRDQKLTQSNSELHVLEARSLGDIDSAFKQIHNRDLGKSIVPDPISDKPESKESEIGSVEDHSDLHVLEARSLEDIDVAFKQLCKGGLEQESVQKLVEDQSKPAEFEAGSIKSETTERHLEPVVLEVKSAEEIELVENQPKLADVEAASAKSETTARHLEPVLEIRSAEEIESSLKEAVVSQESFKIAEESQQIIDLDTEKSEIGIEKSSRSSPRKLKLRKKHKKAASDKSSSSSSSSSSDSD